MTESTLARPSADGADLQCPNWCDPHVCRASGGDVIHGSRAGYWVTTNTQFELQLVRIHDAGAPAPDAPHLLFSAPLPRGSEGADAHELTAADARGLADLLRIYANMVGE